jgi:hypothetical protein
MTINAAAALALVRPSSTARRATTGRCVPMQINAKAGRATIPRIRWDDLRRRQLVHEPATNAGMAIAAPGRRGWLALLRCERLHG